MEALPGLLFLCDNERKRNAATEESEPTPMELSPNDQLHGFTVLTREELPEIDGTAYVLSHRKSGARLLYLANDDANKAFSIAFKTPPADDTGVFHIL